MSRNRNRTQCKMFCKTVNYVFILQVYVFVYYTYYTKINTNRNTKINTIQGFKGLLCIGIGVGIGVRIGII
jgi:hypothetical protein